MFVYLLRFTERLGSDRHGAEFYLGFTSRRRIDDRLQEHRNGEGAKITRAAVERTHPCVEPFTVVWCIRGDRADERTLKRRKRHCDLAPMTPAQVRAYLKRKQQEVRP